MVRAVANDGLAHSEADRRFPTTTKTVNKWIKRLHEDGLEGLRDRSSRPHSLPSQALLATREHVAALRR